MRRLLATVLILFFSLNLVMAQGYNTLNDALKRFLEDKYDEAKVLYESCLSDPEFANDAIARRNIEIKIDLCVFRIKERTRNAQAAENARLKRRQEREANKKVYVSVNASDSKDAWPSGTAGTLFECLRTHERSFTDNIEEALSCVTVNIITKETIRDERYIVDTYGTIRFGNAINSSLFDFTWTTGQCRAVSYESIDDAKRLSYNELNSRLAYALDCFLKGEPVPHNEIKSNNNIVVSLVPSNEISEQNLSEFLDAVHYYIDADDSYTLKLSTDSSVQSVLKQLYLHEVEWTDVDQRVEVAKEDGFRYVLYIEAKKGNEGNYTFKGSILDRNNNNSVKTSKPLSIRVNQLTKSYQELAAAMMCESLGIKQWIIGEDLCGGQLLRAPLEKEVRLPGLICYVLKPTYDKRFPLHNSLSITNGNKSYHGLIDYFDPGNAAYWRYPHVEEIGIMAKYMDALGLRGLYWTGDNDAKNRPIACEIKNYQSFELSKCAKAATIIIREF